MLSDLYKFFVHKPRSNRTIHLQIAAFVEPDGDRFHAFAPAFKGLHVDGETEKIALRNLTDGLSVYLESLVEHGEPLPVGPYCEGGQISSALPSGTRHPVNLEWPQPPSLAGTR